MNPAELFHCHPLYHTPDILTFTGSPQYIQGQWIVSDDSPQYEEVDGLAVQGRIWPARPPDVVELVTEDKNLLTTQGPYVMKEQGRLLMVLHFKIQSITPAN